MCECVLFTSVALPMHLLYALFFGLFTRKSLIWNVCFMYSAVCLFMVGLHTSSLSCVFLSLCSKPFMCVQAFCMSFCLYIAKVFQLNRKWVSSSISFGQQGQYLKLLSMFRCLPFSIIRVWFDSLNLVRATLFCVHFMSVRYFSHPIVVFRMVYVLSLLEGSLIFLKQFWWKASISLCVYIFSIVFVFACGL